MKDVEISVIMSVYKEPVVWIQQAIESILSQTFCNYEFIIVNDNPSGHEQAKILLKYRNIDKRIRLISNNINIGLAQSLNRAILESHGRYIARMDADDIAFPTRLKLQYEYLEKHPQIMVCGCWAKVFGDIPRISYKSYKMPVTSEQITIAALFASPIIHPSVVIRSDLLKCNMYNANLRKAQDYELWGRLLSLNTPFYNIPKYLLKYRVTKKSQSFDNLSKQCEIAELVREKLLYLLGIKVSTQDLLLHNKICNNQKCNVSEARIWLLNIKESLLKSKMEEASYISSLISHYWGMVCLYNDISYKTYCHSNLYYGFSWLLFLRFLKRFISNRKCP